MQKNINSDCYKQVIKKNNYRINGAQIILKTVIFFNFCLLFIYLLNTLHKVNSTWIFPKHSDNANMIVTI